MARFFKKREQLIGEVPGSLIFVGTQKIAVPSVQFMTYDSSNLFEVDLYDTFKIKEHINDKVCWLNIIGIHDSKFIQEIGDIFDIHSLVLEDIMNTAQRAKFEEFEDFEFTAIKMLKFNPETEKITPEQLSFIKKDNILITFQEEPGDVFSPVRDRIRKSRGRIRGEETDYLYYTLLDSVIENYVVITERIGEKIEELEIHILDNANPENLKCINNYKREFNFLSKIIKPAKELIMKYLKFETDNNNDKILPYIRDLYDLFNHTTESIDSYRELLNDYISIYHSNINIKMNDIMRILTIFSALFIPVTFLAGVYGMNFEFLPELKFKYSYLIFWIIVLSTTIGMLLFFRRKKWM